MTPLFTFPGKPATQVSTYGAAVAGRAVDGIYSGTLQHTAYHEYPWLRVDLESLKYVCGVKVWNRDHIRGSVCKCINYACQDSHGSY